jgi:hypothetical protein
MRFSLTQATNAIDAVAKDLDNAVEDISSVSAKSSTCLGALAHTVGGNFDACTVPRF